MMREYKALKQTFGNAAARSIRDAKKELEQNKPATDPVIYWMPHPDLPNSEDCCRSLFEPQSLRAIARAGQRVGPLLGQSGI